MSYVCAWTLDTDKPEEYEFWCVMDTWSEVEEWRSDMLERNDSILRWTVSIPVEGKNSEIVDPEAREEKGAYFDALVGAMPESLNKVEVMATIMTIATHYLEPDEVGECIDFMKKSFSMMMFDNVTGGYEH